LPFLCLLGAEVGTVVVVVVVVVGLVVVVVGLVVVVVVGETSSTSRVCTVCAALRIRTVAAALNSPAARSRTTLTRSCASSAAAV